MELGTRIAALRQRLGINQSELARRVSQAGKINPPLSPQSVQAWEKGGGIRPDKFEALAEALGVSLAELLLGDGFAPSHPARLDPEKISDRAASLLKLIRRRDPDGTLDITRLDDAQLFVAAYEELEEGEDSPVAGAAVWDLVQKRGQRDGQKRTGEQVGGVARGQGRKARTGTAP